MSGQPRFTIVSLLEEFQWRMKLGLSRSYKSKQMCRRKYPGAVEIKSRTNQPGHIKPLRSTARSAFQLYIYVYSIHQYRTQIRPRNFLDAQISKSFRCSVTGVTAIFYYSRCLSYLSCIFSTVQSCTLHNTRSPVVLLVVRVWSPIPSYNYPGPRYSWTGGYYFSLFRYSLYMKRFWTFLNPCPCIKFSGRG